MSTDSPARVRWAELNRRYDTLAHEDPVTALRLGINGSDDLSNSRRAQLAYELQDVTFDRWETARDAGDPAPRIVSPAPLRLIVNVEGDLAALVRHPEFDRAVSEHARDTGDASSILEGAVSTYDSAAWRNAAPSVHDADPSRWKERLTTVWVSIDPEAELTTRGVIDQVNAPLECADEVHDGLMNLHHAGREGHDIDGSIERAVDDVERARTERDEVLAKYKQDYLEAMGAQASRLGMVVDVRDIEEVLVGASTVLEPGQPVPRPETSALVDALHAEARRTTPLPEGVAAAAAEVAPAASMRAGRAWEISRQMSPAADRVAAPAVVAGTNAPGRAWGADRAREVGFFR